MFLGTFEHNIDPKGRLFIPAKFRVGDSKDGGKFILTQGLEHCLYLYTPEIFHSHIASRLTSLPVKNKMDARAFKRMLLAGAQEIELDDLGRLLVPRGMMGKAGLKKEVSILGVGERIELWATSKWKTYNKKASVTFQRLGRHLDI